MFDTSELPDGFSLLSKPKSRHLPLWDLWVFLSEAFVTRLSAAAGRKFMFAGLWSRVPEGFGVWMLTHLQEAKKREQ